MTECFFETITLQYFDQFLLLGMKQHVRRSEFNDVYLLVEGCLVDETFKTFEFG